MENSIIYSSLSIQEEMMLVHLPTIEVEKHSINLQQIRWLDRYWSKNIGQE
jgi:hypothetical protein